MTASIDELASRALDADGGPLVLTPDELRVIADAPPGAWDAALRRAWGDGALPALRPVGRIQIVHPVRTHRRRSTS